MQTEEGVIFALGAAIRSNGTPPNDNIIRDKHVYLYWRMSTVGWIEGGYALLWPGMGLHRNGLFNWV